MDRVTTAGVLPLRGVPIAAAPDQPAMSPRPAPVPRVPPRFTNKSLNTYRPYTASQATALQVVRRWVKAVLAGEGPMLALIGPQGTGKSHLLYGAAKAVAAGGQVVFARPWYELGDQLRWGRPGGPHPMEPAAVRLDFWSAPVVLLDEVRPTSGTAFDDTELAKFACHAYDQRIPVLVTTNYELPQIMGGPAASRFSQVTIVGPDGRKELVEEEGGSDA